MRTLKRLYWTWVIWSSWFTFDRRSRNYWGYVKVRTAWRAAGCLVG